MADFNLVMPKLGESVQEATITKWLVKPGDMIQEDDSLLEIATDKVDSEIPSPVAGKVLKVLFPENALVPVGEVIAVINTEGAGTVEETPAAAAAKPVATQSGQDTDHVEKEAGAAAAELEAGKGKVTQVTDPGLLPKNFPADFILLLSEVSQRRKIFQNQNLSPFRVTELTAELEKRMYFNISKNVRNSLLPLSRNLPDRNRPNGRNLQR